MQETWVRSLSWEDPLEKGMATHSSILAWRIPWRRSRRGSQGASRAAPGKSGLHARWSGLPFPSPVDLPDPRIKPRSPIFQTDSLPSCHQGNQIRTNASHSSTREPTNQILAEKASHLQSCSHTLIDQCIYLRMLLG